MRPMALSNSASSSLSNVPVLPWTFRLGSTAGTVAFSPDPPHACSSDKVDPQSGKDTEISQREQ